MEKSINQTSKLLDELTDYTFERDQNLAKALEEVGGLVDGISEIKKSLTVQMDGNDVPVKQLVAVMAKSIGNVPVDLNQFDIIGDPNGDGNPNDSVLPTWGEMNKTLEKGIKSQAITQQEASRAENAWRNGALNVVKTVMDKCQVKN